MDAVMGEAGQLAWQTMDSRFLHGRSASEWQPEGVLLLGPPDEALLSDLAGLQCPIVRVGIEEDTPLPHEARLVMHDPPQMGQLAARHFLERGFRNLVFVVQESPDAQEVAAPLHSAFRQTAEAGGAECPEIAFLPNLDEGAEACGRGVAAWLRTVTRPLGVLAYGDIFAGHFVGFCHELGVAVPEEVAVMSTGNKRKFCKVSPVPLTSIDPNTVGQGREGVRLLQRMMDGQTPPSKVIRVPPVGVVPRRSTDILAVADVAVANALRFLWEHLAEPISVDDAAAAAGVSRSTLARRFRKHMGRTVNQELLRKRLERCCELLQSTDLSVTDIAPSIGFLSKHYLHRAFRSKYGMSPREFRMRRL